MNILEKAKMDKQNLADKRKEQGMTLDNLFDTKNHFLTPLNYTISLNNDDSIALAEAILKEEERHAIFGRSLGDAFRIAGENGLSQYKAFIEKYFLLLHVKDAIFSENRLLCPDVSLCKIALYGTLYF